MCVWVNEYLANNIITTQTIDTMSLVLIVLLKFKVLKVLQMKLYYVNNCNVNAKFLIWCFNVWSWCQYFLCLDEASLSFSVMLTGTLAFPGGYAMFAAEFSSLCGSPSGAQRQHMGRTGPLTQQHRVFERFPRDVVNAWITRVNPQIAVGSDAHYLRASFVCMSYLWLFLFLDAQSSDAPQTHFYQTASRLCLCLLCWKIESLF